MTIRERASLVVMPLLGAYLGVVSLGGLQAAAGRLLPEFETLISPVVAFAPVDKVTRDKERVCFSLHIRKLHAAVPMKYAFFAEARLSDRIPVAAYLVDNNDVRLKGKAADLETHPVGEHWTRRYCFDLPQTVQDLDIRVSGGAVHRRHPFYDTPTPIPSFNVLAP